MKAPRILFAIALASGTTVALAATEPPAGADPAWMTAVSEAPHAGGVDYAVQNEAEKHRLESQGFPQYTY
jgi:hypothetical protein